MTLAVPGNAKITASRLSDLIVKELPPNPAWIEPSILTKGGTLLLGGEAKVGKSFVMMELGRAVSLGISPFGLKDFHVPQTCKALLVEAEIGEYGLQSRARSIFSKDSTGVYGPNFMYVSKEPRLQLDTLEGRTAFYSLIGDLKPNVLILDPISFMHGLQEDSSVDVGKLFQIMERMKKINPAAQMSIILSHHFRKPPTGRELEHYDFLSEYNFRGSSKWKDAPDTLFTMNRYKELDTPYEAWKLHCRWLTRHGSSPPEMDLTCNRDNDLRVRWDSTRGKLRKLEIGPPREKPGPLPELTQIPMRFEPA